MATAPTPRSYPEVFGDNADAFLSRAGLSKVKAAGPLMSMLEAVSQTQARGSQDTFQLLKSDDLNEAEKDVLDRVGNAEGVPRLQEKAATTTLTVGDSSFQKIATGVFSGAAAPIAGTTALKVADASAFPASGSVYLGRGTSRLEGPIAYTSKSNAGSYWLLNLATPTLRFHNLNESVVLAQGGDRAVPPGSIAQTASGDPATAVQYKTTAKATVLDGETSVSGVQATALKTGSSGNVSAGAVNSWKQAPFANATVSNPSAITNGRSRELDDDYRDRIRARRASKQGGTKLAVETYAVGVQAPDEPKQSVSSSLASEGSGAYALYVDDGTGYEEVDSGVAIEPLIDEAVGGEQTPSLSLFPVARPSLASVILAPFQLAAGDRLAFEVEGQVTEHAFVASDARDISAADAYSVVASVNADPNILWSMRTADGGTAVVAFPRSRYASYIKLAQATADDAASQFSFPSTASYDVRLYQNDLPLNEFGHAASVLSNPFVDWAGISGSQTLLLTVDGVPMAFDGGQFAAFTSADFVDAATGYSSVGPNSPAAWAAVFNLRIPGTTTSVQGGLLSMASNRGNSPSASIQITGGTLAGGMFVAQADPSTGAASDFFLDRGTGEIHLAEPLVEGDSLSAGSQFTRAFIQTAAVSPLTLATDAHFWFEADGSVEVVPSGVSGTTGLDVTDTSIAGHHVARFTSHTAAALFADVRYGDQVVVWEPAIVALGPSGAYRVSRVDPAGTWFEIATVSATTPATNLLPPSAGVQFLRGSRHVQKATVSSGVGYTATSLAAALSVPGLTFATRRTTQLRATADTFATTGGVALGAADSSAQSVGLPVSSAPNLVGQVASLESAGSEVGYPEFHQMAYNSTSGGNHLYDRSSEPDSTYEVFPDAGDLVLGLRDYWASSTVSEWGNEQDFATQVATVSTTSSSITNGRRFTVTDRTSPEVTWTPGDRVGLFRQFQLSYDDQLAMLVDEDAATQRFVLSAARRLQPTTNTYGATNFFTDVDNGGAAVGAAFGASFDFNDWAVFMPARALTDAADANRQVLWRWYKPGTDGQLARVTYALPSGPNQPVAVSVDDLTDAPIIDVAVQLAGGAAATGITTRGTTNWGLATAAPASGLTAATLVVGFAVASAQRAAGSTTLTLTLPAGITNHGLAAPNIVYFKSTDVNFASGAYTITGVAAATVTYADAGPNVGPDANPGTLSYDPSGEVSFAAASPAVAVGQFALLSTLASGPQPPVGQTARVTGFGAQYITFEIQGYGGGAAATVAWHALNDASALAVFANPAQTTSQVVTAVSALTTSAGGGLVPVKPTLSSTGTGLQDRSSAERAGAYPTWSAFADGLNWVKTTSPAASPSNYQLLLKQPVASGLAGTAVDWANEVVYLVPRSAKNVADWASAPAVSGLFTAAEVKRSSGARRLQVASLTPGSSGSVRCQGGTANEAAFPLVGSRRGSNSTNPTFQIEAALAAGLTGGHVLACENEVPSPKATFTSTTQLTAITIASGAATVQLNAGGAPVYATRAAATTNAGVLVQKQGEGRTFVMVSDSGLGGHDLNASGVQEGDWAWVRPPAAPTSLPQLLAQNAGFFRVVRVVNDTTDSSTPRGACFWIENPGAADQGLAECDVTFLTPDSLVPGDSVSIASDIWGAANQGTWTVTKVGDGGGGAYTNAFYFTLDATSRTSSAEGAVAALGSNYPMVQAYDAAPTRVFKRVETTCPCPTDPTLVDITFSTGPLWQRLGAAWGTTCEVLNKIGLPLDPSFGIDGYRRQAGLLGEVGRVIFGDPSDQAAYPGIAAIGAKLDLAGPNVRRAQVAIQVRLKDGASRDDVKEGVQAAVARSINSTPNGVSPAISAYLGAAQRVNGVDAVAPISPTLSAGGTNDVIPVQANEKALVLDPDNDVTVAFAGD
jgi:hypothetical protein